MDKSMNRLIVVALVDIRQLQQLKLHCECVTLTFSINLNNRKVDAKTNELKG